MLNLHRPAAVLTHRLVLLALINDSPGRKGRYMLDTCMSAGVCVCVCEGISLRHGGRAGFVRVFVCAIVSWPCVLLYSSLLSLCSSSSSLFFLFFPFFFFCPFSYFTSLFSSFSTLSPSLAIMIIIIITLIKMTILISSPN